MDTVNAAADPVCSVDRGGSVLSGRGTGGPAPRIGVGVPGGAVGAALPGWSARGYWEAMRDKVRRPKTVAALSLLLAVPLSGCPDDPPEQLEHGVVWLQLLRGASEGDNPYAGTVQVEVTMIYLECLINFYEANPDYQRLGLRDAEIFGTLEDGGEGWKDRLCDQDNSNGLECTVDSFDQEFDVSKHLRVTYSVSGDIEHRELAFGPVPTAGLAQCEGGGQPEVRVGNNGAVRGLDGSGATLWNTDSFDPPSAVTGQGAQIEIKASRN